MFSETFKACVILSSAVALAGCETPNVEAESGPTIMTVIPSAAPMVLLTGEDTCREKGATIFYQLAGTSMFEWCDGDLVSAPPGQAFAQRDQYTRPGNNGPWRHVNTSAVNCTLLGSSILDAIGQTGKTTVCS